MAQIAKRKIRRKDFLELMDLLTDAEQTLAGLSSPRAAEARQTLQQSMSYLRDNITWCPPNKDGVIRDEILGQIVWALDYASGYLDNLLSHQANMVRKTIELTIKPQVNRVRLYAQRHAVSDVT